MQITANKNYILSDGKMKHRLYKVVFSDGKYIIMLFNNEWTLLHYLHDNLNIKGVKIYILSFWESIKYILKGEKLYEDFRND